MKLPTMFAFLVALLLPATLRAQSLFLFGEIGKSPIFAVVNRDGTALSGWYLYLGVRKQLLLSGQIDPNGGFRLDESVEGRKSGSFEGRTEGERWSGAWRGAAGGPPLAFTLTENRDRLASASGLYRCATKRRDKDGWTYAHSLTLELAKGSVKALKASNTVSSNKDDQQGCFYSLEDFTRVPSEVGVLLKARDEDQPLDADSQRCTIRLIGDADHLFVQFGDLTETNNDCRFSGTTAFCSPRSWMADIIVDRRTHSCKSVGE